MAASKRRPGDTGGDTPAGSEDALDAAWGDLALDAPETLDDAPAVASQPAPEREDESPQLEEEREETAPAEAEDAPSDDAQATEDDAGADDTNDEPAAWIDPEAERELDEQELLEALARFGASPGGAASEDDEDDASEVPVVSQTLPVSNADEAHSPARRGGRRSPSSRPSRGRATRRDDAEVDPPPAPVVTAASSPEAGAWWNWLAGKPASLDEAIEGDEEAPLSRDGALEDAVASWWNQPGALAPAIDLAPEAPAPVSEQAPVSAWWTRSASEETSSEPAPSALPEVPVAEDGQDDRAVIVQAPPGEAEAPPPATAPEAQPVVKLVRRRSKPAEAPARSPNYDDGSFHGLAPVGPVRDGDAHVRAADIDSDVVRAHLRGLLEAIIFMSTEPPSVGELARIAQAERKLVKECLEELRSAYKNRGIRLEEVAGGWTFRTNPLYGSFVRELTGAKPVKLTRAQIETLSIVAYRQPITRPEIDDVRGVDSGPMLKVLLERELIRILGKREEPGRPLIYGTTSTFLEFFGLKSLKDMPTLREYSELTEESRRLFERELGEEAPVGPVDMGGLAGGEGALNPPSESAPALVDRSAFEEDPVHEEALSQAGSWPAEDEAQDASPTAREDAPEATEEPSVEIDSAPPQAQVEAPALSEEADLGLIESEEDLGLAESSDEEEDDQDEDEEENDEDDEENDEDEDDEDDDEDEDDEDDEDEDDEDDEDDDE